MTDHTWPEAEPEDAGEMTELMSAADLADAGELWIDPAEAEKALGILTRLMAETTDEGLRDLLEATCLEIAESTAPSEDAEAAERAA